MQAQSRDPKTPPTPKKPTSSDNDRTREQQQDNNTDSQVENDQSEVVVNQQEQNNITNKSGEHLDAGTGMSASGREKSFYRNDLPENEVGADVDERSRQIHP